jgi:hypothetical protein
MDISKMKLEELKENKKSLELAIYKDKVFGLKDCQLLSAINEELNKRGML